jgi:AcrR family transcriptional regulator
MRIGKSDRTRAAIVDGALEFLWSRPFREMTVRSLMASTGVSRSAFYQYFKDVHDLMETLLHEVEAGILEVAAPWFTGEGDPVEQLREALSGLVRVCYQQGPIIRAVADAAPTDARLEKSWTGLLSRFDDVVAARIEADQQSGLIPEFDARPVAVALNRLDAFTLIHAFGRRPRSQPEPVLESITRIWVSTLYGQGGVRKLKT